ncbi:MAG: ABC transporter permease [Acidimicrobiia bacterium]
MSDAGSSSTALGKSERISHQKLDDELSGLDALELPIPEKRSLVSRIWSSAWPKAAAVAIGLGGWQLLVALKWKPTHVLPPPKPVAARLWSDIVNGNLLAALAITMRRAGVGYGLAIAIGLMVGSAVVWFKPLRAAIGSLITGLESMPSIAWFPLAILLFKLSEAAIAFVVVLGAAPAIANGLIAGVDDIPPLLLRAGKAMGARGLDSYRHIVLPAALPSFVDGLKQGWSFAWRSLMAGELLVIIANQPSIGVKLQFARELSDSQGMLAILALILVLGTVVDSLVFSSLSRHIKRRRGLLAG